MIKTKTIAKGKCFGSPAKQRDSLYIIPNPFSYSNNDWKGRLFFALPGLIEARLFRAQLPTKNATQIQTLGFCVLVSTFFIESLCSKELFKWLNSIKSVLKIKNDALFSSLGQHMLPKNDLDIQVTTYICQRGSNCDKFS